MLKFSSLVPVFFTFLFISCSNENPKLIEFKINDAKSSISIFQTSESNTNKIVLHPINIHGIFTDIIAEDSLLICGNLRDPKLINLYSLKTGKLLNEIIIRGTGSNEGLSLAKLSIGNNSFSSIWAYDITLSKFFKISKDRSVNSKNYIPEKEFILGKELKNIISPNIINDSLILATTFSFDDNRYLYANTEKIIKKVGTLPDVTNSDMLLDRPNTKFPNKAFIFKAISIKHPTENKVAVFYNRADRAEFYANDKLIKILHSQESFGPIMTVTKLKRGFSIEENEKTKYAYLSIATNKKYIYGLYSGNYEGKTTSNRILIFNWDGKFIKEVILDREVSKINIDSKNSILYCYDDKEAKIFSATLNF
ncbi:hypothetical protein BAS06_06660 [Elizabethkingia miricola]|uniref:BF3164 family lipoprotein n=1 Tax=Weeksellaceae TaxID=2762318 RepID=UPI00099AA235|nr:MULTISPECIES: BF3164 family lipoprotein [Weeksellaceae]MCT3745949.1 hypothetical protein [Elizabethkingia anophelis]MDC8024572.1 TolB-like 6-bladed beta-propeller domain-containing protein [Elizabethkingia anophelis]MDV3492894.1 hypothetical protein [Elizabethkingia anophelis]MDV4129607.1 hypothetical protein [Elizabethkingia anophelis]MDV4133295.1 hypothetical protein [Elizabethkingia anophelis]